MSALYQIEKLDDANYDSWCIHMRSVLVHSGWWKHVNGSLKRLNCKDDAALSSWDENDEKALATITLCIRPSQLGIIKNSKTSNEAWKCLEAIYKPKGPIQKVSLYKRLLNLTMVGGTDVSQHITAFAELAEKLAETGITIQDELLVIMLLSSLPKEFEQFVVAIETRDSLPNLSTIKQKVLEEGSRHKEKSKHEETTTTQQAFAMKAAREGKTQKEHKKYNNKFKGKCYNCGLTGHIAKNCEKPKKKQPLLLHAMRSTETNAAQLTQWCVDSGATAHMCCKREMFVNFVEHAEEISLAGDKTIVAKGKGDVQIENVNGFPIIFQNVLYSPELHMNFISVSRVVEKGLIVKFNSKFASVQQADGTVVLRAEKQNNLFLTKGSVESLFAATNVNQLWHNRFGHLNYKSLCEMSSKEMVVGLNLRRTLQPAQCRTCMLSKIHVNPFPQESKTRTTDLLEVVHSDVCGPFNVKSPGGSKYFVTFIDDFSRRIFVYIIKAKSDVLDTFKMFQKHVEKQTGRKIKTLRSDNGREYVNKEFDEALRNEGIGRQLTVPYTPQQNGIAERANRTLVEMARSMMVHSGVQQNLWAEAINTAAYLRNRCPTKILNDRTPYEIWFGRKPNIQHLRTFGTYAVALNKAGTGKFEAKGKGYIMVGYSQVAKAYRLYDKDNHSIIERRDVLFEEDAINNDRLVAPSEYVMIDVEGNEPKQSDYADTTRPIVDDVPSDEDDFEGFESAQEDDLNETLVEEVPFVRRNKPRAVKPAAPEKLVRIYIRWLK